MKIVHTGDWHIGKSLRGKERGEEYRAILQELREFVSQQQIDILLIAGDVFDSFNPSAESEEMVYNFFYDVSCMKIATVVIAGNHDSGSRFNALSPLMTIAGVTMVGFLSQKHKVEQVLITTRDKTKAKIAPCPFIPENTFVRAAGLVKEGLQTTYLYSREMGKLLQEMAQDFTRDTVNIIVGHLLMHGASVAGSERRLYLGENYAVHPEQIPANVDYIALGHIHLHQHIAAASPVYYCGSPLQLDFGEKGMEKGFFFLETQPGMVCKPIFIPFRSGKKLIELTGEIEEISTSVVSDPALAGAHLKITLKTNTPTTDIFYQMKKDFPNAVEIRRECSTSQVVEPIPSGTDWLPKFYGEFYQRHYAQNIPPEMMTHFQELYQSASKDNPDWSGAMHKADVTSSTS